MAYSLAEFISHAQAGDPIKITNVTPNQDMLIKIGSKEIQLSERLITKSLNNSGQIVEIVTDTRTIDLGDFCTVRDVLNSDLLRRLILEGLIEAALGTTSLSKVPATHLASFSSSISSFCSSSSSSAAPPIFYFVGNAGSDAPWDTNASRWSNASGGAGGLGVPTLSDSVVFDSNSPNCTFVNGGSSCNNLTMTAGYAGKSINTDVDLVFVYGDLTISGGSFVGGGGNGTLFVYGNCTVVPGTAAFNANLQVGGGPVANDKTIDLGGWTLTGLLITGGSSGVIVRRFVSNVTVLGLQLRFNNSGSDFTVITTAGKKIDMGSNNLFTTGAIKLRSSSTGNAWKLAIAGGGTVTNIDVSDCDSSDGGNIDATDPSNTNSGGNTNWTFA